MSVELTDDGTLFIRLSGQTRAADLFPEVDLHIEQANQVIFDLANQDILSADDIGFLLAVHQQSPQRNSAIINAHDAILTALSISQVDHIIEVKN